MWFTRASINNPVFATMMMLALTILGAVSFSRLSIERLPNVAVPVAVVATPYPGASAEAVEQDVTRPLEEAVNSVSGIKNLTSTSREGLSVVVAEFNLNIDPRVALQDVRDKVAETRRGRFPREVQESTVTRAQTDNDQPIMGYSVVSEKRSLRELSTLSEQVIVKRLANVTGVSTINTYGGEERELRVELKPQQLAAYGVGVDQVLNAITAENQDVPAGTMISRIEERALRVEGKIKRAKDFEKIIVAQRGAQTVTLGDVAQVIDGEREKTSMALVNGKPALTLEIFKNRDANTVDTAKALRERVKDLRGTLPDDVKLDVLWDDAEWVQDSVNNVKSTIVEGALLTVIIVFLFLHSWRSTVITSLTLPISVLAAFIALYAFGFTLNFLTLMALSMSIGILIDDAIVVRENIVRHLGMGKTHRAAAFEATDEIGLAVMATTFSIVAVFMPVAFMGGIIGKFFYEFGVTVTAAVLVSLFVSFTLDPMLSSVWRDPPSKWLTRGPLGGVMHFFESLVQAAHRWYDRVLRWALDHRWTTLAIAFGTFVGSFFLVPFIGSDFVPRTDEGVSNVRIEAPVGSSLEATQLKVQQVEAALREFPEVTSISSNIGTGQGRNTASLWVRFKPAKERTRTQEQLDKAIRERLEKIAGLITTIGWNKPISLSILGPDIATLDSIGQRVQAKLKGIKGATDIESSYKPSQPTLSVRVNREMAADLGLSSAHISNTLRILVAGDTAGKWQGPDGENYTIRVRLPKSEREGVADLEQLYLASGKTNGDGSPRVIPLRQVAEFVPTLGERRIERRNLSREIRITANVEDRSPGEVADDLKKALDEIPLPDGYRFRFGGTTQEMQETFGHAMTALGLACIFIYLILASQFRSFLQPLAIMASLPLSLIGVFLALLFWGSTLNIMSIIGFIMLMGLVTKNAILLVDFANHGLQAGKPLREAILDAGQIRLRPILMTTFAMIFGMLPLALALGPGSEVQSPMAHAVIGGIITSTLLTLVVVPVLYTFMHALGERALRRLAYATPEEAHGGGEIKPQPADKL